MSATHFSGPVVSAAGFTGAVTGAVTGNVSGNVAGNVTGAVLATTPVDVTGATLAVTQAAHAGRTITLNKADGIAVTLPAATGSGSIYRFFVGTTITSSAITIKVPTAAETMAGAAYIAADGGDTLVAFETAATTDTISMNGTTTGGLLGNFVEIIDVATAKFFVRISGSATAAEATPFSATVT